MPLTRENYSMTDLSRYSPYEITSREEYISSLNLHSPTDKCCICLEKAEFNTKCKHSLCLDCFFNWEKIQVKKTGIVTCPYCRGEIKIEKIE